MTTIRRKLVYIFVILFSLSTGVKAQLSDKVEFQLGAGGAKASHSVTNYHFNISSGYVINERISTGTGIGYYIYFDQRTDLRSGIKDGKIEPGNHNAWRPFLYGKYNILPEKRITPFVSLRLGYAFFSNHKFNYTFDKNEDPFNGSQELPDQNLDLKGGVYTTIDLGVFRRIGQKGTKFYGSLSYDLQPLTYKYLSQNITKNISSFGTNIGIVF